MLHWLDTTIKRKDSMVPRTIAIAIRATTRLGFARATLKRRRVGRKHAVRLILFEYLAVHPAVAMPATDSKGCLIRKQGTVSLSGTLVAIVLDSGADHNVIPLGLVGAVVTHELQVVEPDADCDEINTFIGEFTSEDLGVPIDQLK
ncbi:hypothetical protein ON010_g16809 [Phytophthora cinnamomi]|nr:hypothetical protein ON010_g16809 [Phytophthora cinnamomi]